MAEVLAALEASEAEAGALREQCGALEAQLANAEAHLAAARGRGPAMKPAGKSGAEQGQCSPTAATQTEEAGQQQLQQLLEQARAQEEQPRHQAAGLELQLAQAMKEADQGLTLAARAEAAKRELQEEVAALTQQVEALRKAAAALSPQQPGSPNSGVLQDGGRGSGAAGGALAVVAAEARPLLHHSSVVGQISGELAEEVEAVVAAVRLEAGGAARDQLLQGVLALKAARAALDAGQAAEAGLQTT
jgi:hypothetical protein